MSNVMIISSLIAAVCCLIGFVMPKFVKEDDERYGANAVIIVFLLGYFVCMLVFHFAN